MFFRRDKPHKLTFADYQSKAREAGFAVESLTGNRFKMSRGEVAAILEDAPPSPPRIVGHVGIVMGAEIASLVDAGFQKFLQTPSGLRRPALAADLRAIHQFEEDLRATLGLDGAYNESLGTVSNQYIYDRVEERDEKSAKEPWKIPIFLRPKA